MRVAVLCEFSGVVRDAFAARGHEAWSCDLLPTEHRGNHVVGNALDYCSIWETFDLVITHPPCTYLAVSGARWFRQRVREQLDALAFVRALMALSVPRLALENPISVISTKIRKPDQIIQPWQFGHPETKATCLWLRNLPKLTPTKIVDGREARVHRASPGPDRWKDRSRTLVGIAEAMAEQWGSNG